MLRLLSNNWASSRRLPRGRLAAARYLLPSLLMVAIVRLALTLTSLARLRQWLLPVVVSGRHLGSLVRRTKQIEHDAALGIF